MATDTGLLNHILSCNGVQPDGPEALELLRAFSESSPSEELYGRCLDWLELCLASGRIRPSQEVNEAAEHWLSEETELRVLRESKESSALATKLGHWPSQR
jgi:hypothetical protein